MASSSLLKNSLGTLQCGSASHQASAIARSAGHCSECVCRGSANAERHAQRHAAPLHSHLAHPGGGAVSRSEGDRTKSVAAIHFLDFCALLAAVSGRGPTAHGPTPLGSAHSMEAPMRLSQRTQRDCGTGGTPCRTPCRPRRPRRTRRRFNGPAGTGPARRSPAQSGFLPSLAQGGSARQGSGRARQGQAGLPAPLESPAEPRDVLGGTDPIPPQTPLAPLLEPLDGRVIRDCVLSSPGRLTNTG